MEAWSEATPHSERRVCALRPGCECGGAGAGEREAGRKRREGKRWGEPRPCHPPRLLLPPPAPHPHVLRRPARGAVLTGRASPPAERPRCASRQGESCPPVPGGPRPHSPRPGKSPRRRLPLARRSSPGVPGVGVGRWWGASAGHAGVSSPRALGHTPAGRAPRLSVPGATPPDPQRREHLAFTSTSVSVPRGPLRYLSVYLSLHPSCFSTSLRSYPNPCFWPPVLAGLFLCGLRLQADFCPDVRSLLAGRPVQTRRGLAGSLPKGHPSVPLLEASRLGFLLFVC